MALSDALTVLDTAIRSVRRAKRQAAGNVHWRRFRAFDVLEEALMRFEEVAGMARDIEASKGGLPLTKPCGFLTYSSTSGVTFLGKGDRLRGLAYRSATNEATAIYDGIEFVVTPGEVRIKIRGRVLAEVPLTMEGIDENAEKILALASYILRSLDKVREIVEPCHRAITRGLPTPA